MVNNEKLPAGFRDIKVVAEASSIEKWRKQVLSAIGARRYSEARWFECGELYLVKAQVA